MVVHQYVNRNDPQITIEVIRVFLTDNNFTING